MSIGTAFFGLFLLFLSFMLSRSAFHGGFYFATYKILKKGKRLNHFVQSSGNKDFIEEWNNFIVHLRVARNKASMREWMFSKEEDI